MSDNAARWNCLANTAKIDVQPKAIGSHVHEAVLCAAESDSAIGHLAPGEGQGVSVPVVTIDQYVLESGRVPSLIKLDIECYELQALQGATNSLSEPGLKHVILEDWQMGRSEAIQMLRRLGFQIFALTRTRYGPRLEIGIFSDEFPIWEAPNFLATKDIDFVQKAFRVPGWRCLGY